MNAGRLGDICTGHGCYSSRPSITASSNVFVNGRGALRVGDMWSTHCCDSECHSGTSVSGSGSVFVNGRPMVRVGDAISCGSSVMTGSLNVDVG